MGKREAEAEPKAAADPYLLYGGYGHLGYAGYGGYYGHGLGYRLYGKREAEPKAHADPYLLYGRYYGHGLGYAGYGYPYSYGHLGYWGRKRRSAEAEPAAEPEANPEADPYLLYGGYYGHGLGY